jgi:hypothetical protein
VKLLKPYQTKAPQHGTREDYEVVQLCRELKRLFLSMVFAQKKY